MFARERVPAGDRVPAILCLGAYQKDKVWSPPPDLGKAPNPHFHWETPNPLFWAARGYALVRIDTRGSGPSPGRTDPWSPAEAQDYYDAIDTKRVSKVSSYPLPRAGCAPRTESSIGNVLLHIAPTTRTTAPKS